MSVSAEISRLLERAKPLRRLPADEAEDAGLGKLVEEINALRKVEADAADRAFLDAVKAALMPRDMTPEEGADALEPGEAAAAAEFAANPWPAEEERRARVAAGLPEMVATTKRKPGRPKKAD